MGKASTFKDFLQIQVEGDRSSVHDRIIDKLEMRMMAQKRRKVMDLSGRRGLDGHEVPERGRHVRHALHFADCAGE